MILETLSGAMQVSNPGANSTAASVVQPAPFSGVTYTDPMHAAISTGVTSVGDGVIACGELGLGAPNGLLIIPYGAGSSTNTFVLWSYGWKKTVVSGSGITEALWIPFLLAKFTCTLCTQAGIANTPVNASQLFAGTITLSTGNANVSNEIISPTGNVIASIMLDVKGSQYVEFRFDMNSSATSANCLVARL